MKSAEDYLKDGDKYRQRRKWWEAVKAYTKAIKLGKNDFRSYERLGRVYFELGHSMLGDKDAVAADFVKAIELQPRQNVYLHKALAFSQLGEYDQAIADLSRAIELKADYAYAYLNRGVIYQNLGEKDKAKAYYQHTMDLDTNRSWSEQSREHLQALTENE